MIVLVDNYDSFSYNLYQMLGEMDRHIAVVRNDEKTVSEIEAMHPDYLVISPGPGRPADAGICEEAIQHFAGKVPILGVCLGHQAICEVFGGEVTYADHLMHGKQSIVHLDTRSPIFAGMGITTSPCWIQTNSVPHIRGDGENNQSREIPFPDSEKG